MLVKLCEDCGKTYHCTSGQNPHLIRNGRRIDCKISNYVPFVVPGLSASSSSTALSPTSPSSSSQDSVFHVNRCPENPLPERSGCTSEELRGDPLHEPTETENKNKNEGCEEVQRDISHELPDWLQEIRENLVDESTSTEPWRNPEQGSQDTSKSSHELPMKPRAKVEPGSGKHSVYTHFPKDPNCDICLRTKITRASCRRRTGTVVPRAERFGDLITADHKVLSEESESRNNHRYGWWYKTWQHSGYNPTCVKPKVSGNSEEPNEVPGADEQTQSHLHCQCLGTWQVLRGIIMESWYVNTTQI